jgi:hypothetical protein
VSRHASGDGILESTVSTHLKVLDGTRSSCAPRLCDTCHTGGVRRGAADSDEHVYCTLIEREVRTRVVECNRYTDRNQPSLWDLRQIAWVLRTDAKRQKIGFIRAKEWERLHEDEELLPPHLA